ncbi:MAG: Holliday junction branch migration protein RuvA [Bacteroidetes bacterium]|nr:Holliday junction branch migration protein RuvA [Bacteroidia bacterium]MBN8696521.1 Holliday junction branch migration protein RuvA [Bacteroidota bacterium]
MIHHIEGRLVEKTPTYAVIDAGGVGYIMQISLNTFSKIGESEKCKLYTEQLYVRDDMPRFFGFADVAERNLFRLLVSVSGVGGTSALLMLSSLSAAEIQTAIATGNVALIKSVKGIGEKTAQRIIVDLKGKMGKEELSSDFFVSTNNTLKEEALSALVALGFNKSAADKVLDKIVRTEGAGLSVEQLIKSALKNL